MKFKYLNMSILENIPGIQSYIFDGSELSDFLKQFNKEDTDNIVENLNKELNKQDIYITYLGNDLMDYSGDYYHVQVDFINKNDEPENEVRAYVTDLVETEVEDVLNYISKTFTLTSGDDELRYDYEILSGNIELQTSLDYNDLEDDSDLAGITFGAEDFLQKLLNDYDGEIALFNLNKDKDVTVNMCTGSIVNYYS